MITVLALTLERSRLEAILAGSSLDPVVLATALGGAFVLGAAHALTPGHGKAIVAAYLAGSRGRILDAIYLGGVVTATHTAMVFVLGFAALYASQHVALDRIYPWLAALSGALVAGFGAWLLWQRTRPRRHAHPHDHHHDHHGGHGHSHPHSHAPASRGGLLSLGVSGGLVPCPEAMVVLMISISLRRIGLGLAILVSFSIGLAAVLIAIGIAMVLAAPVVTRFTGERAWVRMLPVASAAVVTALGVVLMVQSLASARL
ncbi:MAG: sulfite exporter TauE/SafE family protein [Bryobacterales bacterium]|nr:sulfite exporter TauE/SafE family protein [Bryobacterales bacterium]